MLMAALACLLPVIGSGGGALPWAAALITASCVVAATFLEGQAVEKDYEVTKRAFEAEENRARRQADDERFKRADELRAREIEAKLAREKRFAEQKETLAKPVDPSLALRIDNVSVALTQLEDDVEKLKLALHLRQVSVPSKS